MTESAHVDNDSMELTAKQLISSMPEEDQKSLRSWYFFDFANQAFALTVLSVVVPALIASLFDSSTGGGMDFLGGTLKGDSFYSIVLAISMFIVAITSPAIGVIADKSPIKKKLLYWYTLFGVLFTAMLGCAPFFGNSAYQIMAVFFVIANIGFAGGNTFYYAFMPYLAPKKAMDHVSSWGYAYGFLGGSIMLIVHLAILVGLRGLLEPNLRYAIVFVTAALWWWGWSLPLFKNTPEPEVEGTLEVTGFMNLVKFSYGQVFSTFKEIKKFKVLALYLVAYLLFYDGVNTVNGIASAFAETVLRIDPVMNIVLLLTVQIVAVPMSVVFGKIADSKGTKFALLLALIGYSFVAITAAGFAPLELEPNNEDDHKRFDFHYEWIENEPFTDSNDNGVWDAGEDYTDYDQDGAFTDEGLYVLNTLYGRGVEGWVSLEGDGDAEFRDAFGTWLMPEESEEVGGLAGSALSGFKSSFILLACFGAFGFIMLTIFRMNLGKLGVGLTFLVAILAMGAFIGGGIAMFEDTSTEDMPRTMDADGAEQMVAAFDSVENHRFSIVLTDGPQANEYEIGNEHPTILKRGGLLDWWADGLRNNVWGPLGLGINIQWIFLGLVVGCVMGAAGAQARSMFTMLIPKTRTTEFFGFFGFIGKAAAMIGPLLYAAAAIRFDSRVAILTIVVVIVLGTFLTGKVDLEEGIRVAEAEDEKNLAASGKGD